LQDWAWSVASVNTFALSTGNTPANMTAYIYAWYTDVELMIPSVSQGPDETGGWLSNRLSYASDILAVGGSVFPFLTPWALLAGGAGAVAKALGFTRPQNPAMQAMQRKVNSSLAHVSGVPDFSEKLSLDPANAQDVSRKYHAFPERHGSKVLDLVQMPCLVVYNITTITTSVPLNLNCCPWALPVGLTANATYYPNGLYQLTTLGFVSGCFTQWSGSMVYTVEFVANAFCRGTFALQIIPPGVTAPTTFSPTSGYITKMVEVCGRTLADITVPWLYQKPYILVNSAVNPYPGTSVYTRLMIWAFTAVQSGTTTPPTIPVNVWVRGGPDTRFAVPGISWPDKYTLCSSSTINQGPADDAGEVKIGTSMPVNMLTYGEDVIDLQLLTRRFCPMVTVQTANGNLTDWFSLPVVGISPESTVTIGQSGSNYTPMAVDAVRWCFSTWIASAFYTNSGGYRFKVAWMPAATTETPPLIGFRAGLGRIGLNADTYTNPVNTTYTSGTLVYGSTGYSLQDLRFTPMAEVEVPSRQCYRVRPSYRLSHGASTDTTDAEAVFISNLGAAQNNVTVWHAAADDFSLGAFLCCPVLGYE